MFNTLLANVKSLYDSITGAIKDDASPKCMDRGGDLHSIVYSDFLLCHRILEELF